MMNLAQRFGRFLQRLEDLVLGGLLAGMILLAAFQIVLRNGFDGGLIWGDELLRILVLWTGLIGAAVASRERRHITIDVLSRLLPERQQRWAGQLVALFTGLVSALIAWHAGRFVQAEFSSGATGPGGLSSGWFELVLPVCFALISLRYLVDFVRQVHSGRSHEGGA
jgi:TRAP-type C4-dicarboxylate transport system permease small subunit